MNSNQFILLHACGNHCQHISYIATATTKKNQIKKGTKDTDRQTGVFTISMIERNLISICFPRLILLADDDSEADEVTDYLTPEPAQPYVPNRDYNHCVGGHDGPAAAAAAAAALAAASITATIDHYNNTTNLKLNKKMTHHQPILSGHNHHLVSGGNGSTAVNHHHPHHTNNNNHINNNMVPIISVTPHSPGSKHNNLLGSLDMRYHFIYLFRFFCWFAFYQYSLPREEIVCQIFGDGQQQGVNN